MIVQNDYSPTCMKSNITESINEIEQKVVANSQYNKNLKVTCSEYS